MEWQVHSSNTSGVQSAGLFTLSGEFGRNHVQRIVNGVLLILYAAYKLVLSIVVFNLKKISITKFFHLTNLDKYKTYFYDIKSKQLLTCLLKTGILQKISTK